MSRLLSRNLFEYRAGLLYQLLVIEKVGYFVSIPQYLMAESRRL